jgi:hypothetical protein
MTKYVRLAREDNSLNSQCTFHLESIYFANNLFVDKLVIISTLCEFSHCMGLAKGLKQPCPQLFLIKVQENYMIGSCCPRHRCRHAIFYYLRYNFLLCLKTTEKEA